MTRYFKDNQNNKVYTTDELGRNQYQMVSHSVFPTLRSFLEFCSVENGGTLQEISKDEWFIAKCGMTEAEYIAEREQRTIEACMETFRTLKRIEAEERYSK